MEEVNRNKYKGKKYGLLTFGDFLFRKKKSLFYKFNCDCGNTCIKSGADVRRKAKNFQPNCGCLLQATYTKWEEKVGEKRNKITLVEYLGKDKNNAARFIEDVKNLI